MDALTHWLYYARAAPDRARCDSFHLIRLRSRLHALKPTLDHAAIAALIPHQGAMCLLDAVLSHDDEGIVCRAVSHRDAANPLRENGALHVVCGVEYAAQAMAIHGALCGGLDVTPGVLAGIREVHLAVERLDDLQEDLIVTATRLLGDRTRLLYEFKIAAGAREIMRGRATVILDVRPG